LGGLPEEADGDKGEGGGGREVVEEAEKVGGGVSCVGGKVQVQVGDVGGAICVGD